MSFPKGQAGRQSLSDPTAQERLEDFRRAQLLCFGVFRLVIFGVVVVFLGEALRFCDDDRGIQVIELDVFFNLGPLGFLVMIFFGN